MSVLGIIPAAGKGTRFKELGKQYSKSVLPVNNKPLIVFQIEYMLKYCDKIRVVLGHNSEKTKEIINLYFKDAKIEFCYQETLNGLAKAIDVALYDDVYDDVFIVLSDILPNEECNLDKSFISVQEVNDYSRWCMVSEKFGYVDKFFDKPVKRPDTNMAVSGMYFFKDAKYFKECLKTCNIKIQGEYQLSSAMEHYIKRYQLYIEFINIIDFGTLDEYLKNRNLKECRSFNDIKIFDGLITKQSNEKEKIINELSWYKNIPMQIKKYTPRVYNYDFYSSEHASYTMDYIEGQTLRDIFLFLDSDIERWNEIFSQIEEYLKMTEKFTWRNSFLRKMYTKTVNRIKSISIKTNESLINNFLKTFNDQLNQNFIHNKDCIIHGDLCFSNIISTNAGIKLIDPRGEIFGSQYYDIAKLMHSILYNYDFIDTELYVIYDNNIKLFNDGKLEIIELFNKFLRKNFSDQEIIFCKFICASLFISMIPLHYHNVENQKLFYNVFENICRELEIYE